MEGGRPEGHVADPRNTRMEETIRRRRRMGASSERGQGSERGCSAVNGMECWVKSWGHIWLDQSKGHLWKHRLFIGSLKSFCWIFNACSTGMRYSPNDSASDYPALRFFRHSQMTCCLQVCALPFAQAETLVCRKGPENHELSKI